MTLASTATFLILILAAALAIWGLFAGHKSVLVGLASGIVAILAALGAWYAWAESNSLPWTLGYGLIFLMAVASSIRQFSGGGHAKN